jgi:hypothetical protein
MDKKYISKVKSSIYERSNGLYVLVVIILIMIVLQNKG